MHAAQEESDAIKCNAEDFRMRTELAMNDERVAHWLKILEFNEKSKQFAVHQKQFDADEAQRLLREAEWRQKENSEWLKELQCSQQFAQQNVAAGRTAAPTAPLRSNPPPPPRMEQAAASMHQVSTIGLQHARREAQVIATETAYHQLIANAAVDVMGPQAEVLQAEAKWLRMEFDRIYGPSVMQRSAAAPAATLGAGAGTSASTSAPVPPLSSRPAPSTPTVPVETAEQRKE